MLDSALVELKDTARYTQYKEISRNILRRNQGSRCSNVPNPRVTGSLNERTALPSIFSPLSGLRERSMMGV